MTPKSLFVICSKGEADTDWSPWHEREAAERYVREEIIADTFYDGYEPSVREFVELTPRVRLGLWLAENSDRGWVPFQWEGEPPRVEFLTASEGACLDDESGGYDLLAVGHGPSLDAAIEDALAKLPKETS